MDSQTLLNFLQTSADSLKNRPPEPPELATLNTTFASESRALVSERDAALSALETLRVQVLGSLNPLINMLKSSGYDGAPIAPFVEPQDGTAIEHLKALQAWVQSTRDSLYMAIDDHKAQQQAASLEQQREAEQTKREERDAQEEHSQAEQSQHRRGSGKNLRRTIRRAVVGFLALLLIVFFGFGVYVFINRPYFNPPPVGAVLVRTSGSDYSHQLVRADGQQSEMLLDYGIHPAWSIDGNLLYCGNVRGVNGLVISSDCPVPPTSETTANSQFTLVPSVDPAYIAVITERPNNSYQQSRTDDTVTVYYNGQPLGSFDFSDSVLSVSWAYPLSLVVVHDSLTTEVQYTRISLRSGTRDALFGFSPEPDPYHPLFQLSPGSQYAAYRTTGQRSLVIANYTERVVFEPRIIPDTEGITSLAWSPDQKYLAYTLPDGIYILDLESDESVRISSEGLELLRGLNSFDFGRSLNLYRPNPILVGWGADGETDTYESVIDPMDPTQIAVAFAPLGSFDAEATAEVTEEFNTATPALTPTHTASPTVPPTNTSLPSTTTPTLTPTHTPTATRTIAPTATELITCMVSTDIVINARREPNTSADQLPNGLQPGRYTAVAAQLGTDNRYWYQLENGYWVREDVVRPVGDDSCFALISRLLTPEAVASVPTVQANAFEATADVSTNASTGDMIAFASNRDGNFEIYVANADGSNQRRLTNNLYSDINPTWSPDGTQIIFQSNRDTPDDLLYDLYVMNLDGSNSRRLTNSWLNQQPRWSPNGRQIAYTFSNNGFQIYLMESDGSQVQPLTSSSWNENPDWSPDGSRIVFTMREPYGKHDIFVMNVDGTNITQLTDNDVIDTNPRWSPDGSQIVFESYRDNSIDIYVMNTDGTNVRRLTNNSGINRMPDWSADGQSIVFVSSQAETSGIYIMNVDGTNIRSLIESEGTANYYPDWSPVVDFGTIHLSEFTPTPVPTRTSTNIPPTIAMNFPTAIVLTDTPYPTALPPTSTPLPPSISVSQLPTTAITNGNASQLSLIGTVPLPVTMNITGISADRSVIAIGGSGRLYAYDLVNLRLLELPNAGGYSDIGEPEIAISPDGRYIAYPAPCCDYTVNVYSTTQQRIVATLRSHTDNIEAVLFSPTGLTLATAADEAINLWEVGTWVLTRSIQRDDALQLRADNVFSLAFSPNGAGILAGTYGNVDLWDVATGTLAGSVGSTGRSTFSTGATQQLMVVPAAAALVGLTEYRTIDVWNLQTLDVTASFSVDTRHFDVNVGGNLLVTEDSGGFNVYSFFTTERIFTGTGSYSFPSKVYFSRNDTLLVVVKSNEIQLWGIP